MKITVHYYGMIADKLSKSSEEIQFNFDGDSLNLKTYFENKYPLLKDMSYQTAVNQELTQTLKAGIEIKEIALLPPFAGG